MARTEPRVVLICLGNPGPERSRTRHNAGYAFADYLQRQHGLSGFRPLGGVEAEAAEGEIAGLPVLLVRPSTVMNECGRVVAPLLERYPPGETRYGMAHDDLDVPIGSVKGRSKGGHGGHNGVRSILAAAGGGEFFRIKLGVNSAAKADYDSVADFLLSEFLPAEREELETAFPQAEEALIGQIKSHAAELAKLDRAAEVKTRYVEEALTDAREALGDLSAASPYPVFLNRREMGRAFDMVTALAKLLRKAKLAAAGDDEFCARLLGFIPDELRPLLPPRAASDRIFFAVDLHLAEGQLKVIELNCAVGYAHYAALADEALFPLLEERFGGIERPFDGDFASFLYAEGLRPMHDPARGVLAFLRGFNDRDMFNVDELEGLAGRIEEREGLSVPLCHERDLELQGDGLHLADGRRVDLLYVEENLAEWAEVAEDSPLRAAVVAGLVKTFPPLDTFLLTNKGFLSLLVYPSVQRLIEPDEAEGKVIRRNVLWSHPLDEHVEPAAYHMLEQGLTLVVKDALGGGGRGVTVLRPDSSSQQTGHILRRRMLGGRSVVQGYFPSGRWSEGTDLRFDVRILAAAHEADIAIGPVYARIFRGEKVNFTDPDSGVAPVYVIG